MSAPSIQSIREGLRISRQAEISSGDGKLNPDLTPLFAKAAIPAAVLILIIERRDEPYVLLTKRPEIMKSHAGQICFPGGRSELTDDSPVTTALRETQEEVGIAPECIEILGTLPLYMTRTGYNVTPVVGYAHCPFQPVANPQEVVEIFEAPLSFFMDPANCHIDEKGFMGKAARFYSFEFENKVIWGATAGMLVDLRNIVLDTVNPGPEPGLEL